jgi:hypothetical protein
MNARSTQAFIADEESNLRSPRQQQLIEQTINNNCDSNEDDAGTVTEFISNAAGTTNTSSVGGLTSRLYKCDSTISNANSSSVGANNIGEDKYDITEDDSYDEEDRNKKTKKKREHNKAKSMKSSSQGVTGDRATSTSDGGGTMKLLLRYIIQKVASTVGPTFQKLPRPYRYALLILWLLWKIVMTIVFLNVVFKSWSSKKKAISTKQRISISSTSTFRILHVVTALQEYDTKSSTDGETTADRLTNILLPVLSTIVQSLTAPRQGSSWSVDVYLILGYKLLPHRYKQIQESLPPGVGLQVWDDAIPLGYDEGRPKKEHMITPITRTLARQHRFVLKVSSGHVVCHKNCLQNLYVICRYTHTYIIVHSYFVISYKIRTNWMNMISSQSLKMICSLLQNMYNTF